MPPVALSWTCSRSEATLTAWRPAFASPCSTPVEVLWSFSIFLESVAILPQLFMLSRTGEAETITAHYLFALGLYRALYIPNWIYRYFERDPVTGLISRTLDPIAITAGIVQTVLYADFFYSACLSLALHERRFLGCLTDSLLCPGNG